MTTVQAISAAPKAADNAAPKSSAGSLDYSAFLQLLIAQLKNQDPTKPMDSTQFVAQLATFSQVEQSVASNAKLDSLLTSSALSLADAVIGRTVTSADGTVTGKVTSVKITGEGPVATLENGDTLALGAGVVIR
jgi:flagellar basal-body rod modification protein FlgD